MAKAQIDNRGALFSVYIPKTAYEQLLELEQPGFNFRQVAQRLLNNILAEPSFIEELEAAAEARAIKADEQRADSAFAHIQSAMANYQPEESTSIATL